MYINERVQMIFIELSRYNQTVTFMNCSFYQNENAWRALISVSIIFDLANTTCLNPTNITIENSIFLNNNNNNSPVLYFADEHMLTCSANAIIIGLVYIHHNSVHEHTIAMFGMTVNLTGPVIISNNTAQNAAVMLFDSCDILFSKDIQYLLYTN